VRTSKTKDQHHPEWVWQSNGVPRIPQFCANETDINRSIHLMLGTKPFETPATPEIDLFLLFFFLNFNQEVNDSKWTIMMSRKLDALQGSVAECGGPLNERVGRSHTEAHCKFRK
jgi:hypothetical protein